MNRFDTPLFDTLLVANRGEIACRIIESARKIGLRTVAVFSEADRGARHVRLADEAVLLGPAPAKDSYLKVEALLAAAAATGAGAIHPGYGFLSEDAGFAEAVEAAGLVFVGPTPDQLRIFGTKHTARDAARAAGVPMIAGSGLLPDVDAAVLAARDIGFPLMLKATGGGGGIGMTVCRTEDELTDSYPRVARLAGASFSTAGVFAERYVEHARHVEVQIFGDGDGRVVSLGDRDCSLQRRHQKVLEEAPAPDLPAALRDELHRSSRALCASLDYRSAGTVEFVYDPARKEASFLEVNARLQVEHPVTEAVTGVDLVEWMLRLAQGGTEAAGVLAGRPDSIPVSGHAVEARLYAEDPARNFQPSSGTVTNAVYPGTDGVRVDAWVETGSEVSTNYDPLLAKIITTGTDRNQAFDRLGAALKATRIDGIETNLGMLRAVTALDVVRAAAHSTGTLNDLGDPEPRITVERPGLQTSVQDWPGRAGLWQVGVPPSGPMDDLSFRLGNQALGNAEGAPGLEFTMTGPSLHFTHATTVCVTGARHHAHRGRHGRAGLGAGRRCPRAARSTSAPPKAPACAATSCSRADSTCRCTWAARPPSPWGSSAATAAASSGPGMCCGPWPRTLPRRCPGSAPDSVTASTTAARPAAPGLLCSAQAGPVPLDSRPVLTSEWELTVVEGPHGAPEFFQREDIDDLYAASYEVHFNSARTGVRLDRPEAAVGPHRRRRGGTAPVEHPRHRLLGRRPGLHRRHPDPARPGRPQPRRLRLPGHRGDGRPLEAGPAAPRRHRPVRAGGSPAGAVGQGPGTGPSAGAAGDAGWSRSAGCAGIRRGDGDDGVLGRVPEGPGRPAVTYRRSGDDNLLVEYGDMVLDLSLRARVHALHQHLEAAPDARASWTSRPGSAPCRSRSTPTVLPAPRLLGLVREIEAALPASSELVVPSRTVRLPLSWDDPATREAIQRYMAGVRDDAPWCPWNIEFIRRINGLDVRERRLRHRLRRRVPGPGPRRRLPGRPGGHARWIRATAWSPRSTTRPGPGRRRTPSASAAPTCASTAWKDPAATSSSAGPPRCGPATPTPRRSNRARPGCCGSSTASPGTRSAPRSCWTCGRTWPPAGDAASRSRTAPSPWPTTRTSWPRTASPSPSSGRSRPRRSPPNGRPGRTAGEFDRADAAAAVVPAAEELVVPDGATPGRRTLRRQRVEGGRHRGRPRGDRASRWCRWRR